MENSISTDGKGEDTLARLVQFYESAEQATVDGRRDAERCRDYRNGNQWTQSEIATLEKRRQPVITIDRIGPKVDYLLGMETTQRSDPKAYPRTPTEEQNAEAATDSLRFVMDQHRWDDVRSAAFDGFIVEGVCGVDVAIVEKYEEKCIEVRPIMWDRLFFDPHSRQRDFSDAKYKGQFIWMDLDEALDQWPEGADALNSTMSAESASQGQTYDDVPRMRWADPKRKRVRIVEMWTHEDGGQVFYSKFTKAGVLERMPSPYVDEHGQQEDGFEFGSCYVDRDGDRFGVVRRWLSLQDEINKRRSKALHLVNTRQTFGNQLTGEKNKLRQELAKPDGHVELAGEAKFGEDFGVIPTADMATAQFQLLQESKAEIDAVGVNAAMQGTENRNMSGRAQLVRAEQGMNELGPVFDWFKSWQLAVYRKVWNRVRQYWTAEKWIRVTDDEKNVRFVGINQPLTLAEAMIERATKQGQPFDEQAAEQMRQSPALQQTVGVKNPVAEMDVDITLDAAPATASLQHEQFQALAELAKSGIQIPPRALIKASSIRNKDQILEEMEGGANNGAAAMQKLQQAAQHIEELTAKLQEAQSGIATAHIDAQSRENVARINAAGSFDEATLNALADLLKAKMTPPPQLAGAVSEDLAKQ